MAIVKIGVMQPSTPGEFDWSNLMKHINAFNRQVSGLQYPVNGTVIKESSYIQHGGVLYQVQGGDYTILGSLSAGVFNYVKITVSGENLIATWITDISAYSWSNEYNYLVASDESSLLALTERDSIVYRLEGKNEIYKSNQNLNTDSDVEFNKIDATTVNTGHGNNELYPMNQSVKTDSDIIHNSIKSAKGYLLQNSYITNGIESITVNDIYDLLSGSLPNINDILSLHGSNGADSTYTYVFSFAKRTAADTILIYWERKLINGVASDTGHATIVDGNTSEYLRILHMAW